MASVRGKLKVLIGAAPGVGKTYDMLREGQRLKESGVDVVVAFLETHGREATARQAQGLEVIARRTCTYRNMTLTEMDVFAILQRHPKVALVDELAHSNPPSSLFEKRWQDVQNILEAGIDVITTINVQHIESLNDVVRAITGSVQQETVPDIFLRSADQVEVVDLPPQMLRERLSEGLIYAPDRVDAALSNYFRVGNLTALRELTLLWLAGNVDEALKKYREEQGIHSQWETRERVVVALSGGDEGETLLRRGARVAARSGGGQLIAVHVTSPDGLRSGKVKSLAEQRSLVEKLGGSFHQVVGEDIVESLIEFAEAVNATQIVIGVSSRGSLRRSLGRPSVSKNILSRSGSIDVHLVPHGNIAKSFTFALPKVRSSLPPKRKIMGLVFCAVTLPLLTLLLLPGRNTESLPRDILAYQLLVVLAATIGGMVPAIVAALTSGLIIDYFFLNPMQTFNIYQRFGFTSLLLYVIIALTVSLVVDQAERRSHAAARSRAESELLSVISGSVLRSRDPLQALLDRLREAFGLRLVILSRKQEPDISSQMSQNDPQDKSVDDEPADVEDDWQTDPKVYELNHGDAQLMLYGRDLDAKDQRLFNTVLTQIDTVLQQEDLERKASEVEPLTEADKIRSALLTALSHDLRRPLASATAAVSGLIETHGNLDRKESDELLHLASAGLQELAKLITDLLDVSRLREDALPISLEATDTESIIVTSLDELNMGPREISLDMDRVPLVCADPPLLRRALSNLLLNAKRFNPPDKRIVISVSHFRDRVEIRIVDYGPGVSEDKKNTMFVPFQRLGDKDNTTGLGLGLALAKGFVESMDGVLSAEDTPGGGLTMVISLHDAPKDARAGQPLPHSSKAKSAKGSQPGIGFPLTDWRYFESHDGEHDHDDYESHESEEGLGSLAEMSGGAKDNENIDSGR
ncbi:ATP-binding protein [Bifidobacterium aquikefiricola]|uniref:histidine kinase n=1 Tax=Bifidobacterium aquikefiricola TaxID=3059038 RepID=A0AB39U5D1_9BIFI